RRAEEAARAATEAAEKAAEKAAKKAAKKAVNETEKKDKTEFALRLLSKGRFSFEEIAEFSALTVKEVKKSADLIQ
ncbi:MAG: hypothetical protein NC394_09725, partial [Bacteroides sp.]|nr:hypothetical protein [Bacteroides sp.]